MISRRDLLFGAIRRWRKDDDRPVSGIGADIGAADMAFARKDYAAARELYKAVLKANRLHKEARVRLGLCHYHLEEYVQAKDTLLMALRQHPQDYLARLYLGLSYARRRQVEKCMDVWKDFMNREHIGVMREINAHKALHECGEALDGIEMADAVEKALAQG